MVDAISLIIDIDDEIEDIEAEADIKDNSNEAQDAQKAREGSKRKKVNISVARPVDSQKKAIYSYKTSIADMNTDTSIQAMEKIGSGTIPFTRDVQLSDPVDVLKRIIEVDAILDVIMHNFNFKESVDQSRAMNFFNSCVSRRPKDTASECNKNKMACETAVTEKSDKKDGFYNSKQRLHKEQVSQESDFFACESDCFEKINGENLFLDRKMSNMATNKLREGSVTKIEEKNNKTQGETINKYNNDKALSVYEIEARFGFLEHYIQYVEFIKKSVEKKSDIKGEEEMIKKLLESPVFIDMIVAEGNRLSLYFEDLEFLKKAVDGGSPLNNSLYLFFMDRFK